MNLGIVIINYRTPKITLDCLASLAIQIDDVPETRVVLIDNASGDDSAPQLRSAIETNHWSRWIQFIESPTNRGFAGGNNLGIAACGDCKYILLLNSDTIAQPNVLRRCFDAMEADATIGVLSSMLLNPDQSVQNTARKFPTPVRQTLCSLRLPWLLPKTFGWADTEDATWDRRTVRRNVDWVGGAFMMIRGEIIRQIGALDEAFFFYGEDAEFCHRVQTFGWKVRYDPSSSVIHLGGASSDPQRLESRERNYRSWQARYLLQRKCYGLAAEWWIRFVDILANSVRYLKLLATGRGTTDEFARQRDILAILLRWPAAGQTVKG